LSLPAETGRRPSEIDQEALIYSPPQDRDIYAAEQRELLSQALGRLSEQERLLYHLCFVFEQDACEVAAVFGTEVRIVYKRKQTLVLKLKRLVQSFQSC
jgi:DNA-directed RNA polymerase specialized sigma subunit